MSQISDSVNKPPGGLLPALIAAAVGAIIVAPLIVLTDFPFKYTLLTPGLLVGISMFVFRRPARSTSSVIAVVMTSLGILVGVMISFFWTMQTEYTQNFLGRIPADQMIQTVLSGSIEVIVTPSALPFAAVALVLSAGLPLLGNQFFSQKPVDPVVGIDEGQ